MEIVTTITLPVFIGLIVVINEIIKPFGLNPKWLPVIDLVLGAIGGYFFAGGATIAANVVSGIIASLTANGVYSAVKNTSQAIGGLNSGTEETEVESK